MKLLVASALALLGACSEAQAETKTTKTNVADFELTEQNGKFLLHDDSYDIVFPIKPQLASSTETSPTGAKVPTVTALAERGTDEIYGLFLLLVPSNVPYDVDVGTKGARDGVLKNTNGKLLSEKSETFGGLSGKMDVASATMQGLTLYIELHLAWDPTHRVMIGAFVAHKGSAPTEADKAFVSSFKVNPKGKATPR
jgi:hypothetical protein